MNPVKTKGIGIPGIFKLIEKYQDRRRDKNEVVYKLSYARKFIIVKGNTLCGSLIIINETYQYYLNNPDKFKDHLYRHLYDHYLANPGGRFRIKTLARVDCKTDQYMLLKREQMELDKHRYDPDCLNNNTEAYIPLWNDLKNSYGWLSKGPVMNFQRWLNSKERKAYQKRYQKRFIQSKIEC